MGMGEVGGRALRNRFHRLRQISNQFNAGG
jgi:hypothetical protein